MIHSFVAAAVLAASALAPAAPPAALPLGDPDLAETRTVQTLARGVTLTRIVRGTEPAPSGEIGTTTRGPWRINVLTVDPRTAKQHLKATYGPDLSRTETVSDLVAAERALAGVNASFFTFTASQLYPGTPVGLGIHRGKLLSEPTTDPAEADLVVDSARNRMVVGKLSWSSSVRNPRTGVALAVETINDPGAVAVFTPEFGASTPAGDGAEVVLDRRGCVVRTAATRGTALVAGQTAVQATGERAAALVALAVGCLRLEQTVTGADGERVVLRPGTYGVNGRYRLTEDGRIVVPAGTGSFFERNPRTIAGTTRTGKLVFATIDGRMTSSVGTTMDETAAVAHALGLRDAINLDGGGSTTMVAAGQLINQPSGGVQRPVGDALILK
ncbi:phosphodiester glycosidase family protein [Paractinoplanes lichenicola]|uniref:Phosphodiester glycosidase family protein n=1 Tax=Paractinoplanes lichenicola TaxID=2802976 RepID=A0ABS1VZ86_9ACTN|nr:phosphodiester glycosidase family protein [Actinoplanes lichenicola]MBL7259806.1 phosphodiester glycosidase family protein [Actinoplanes lichenicola]